MLIEIYHIKNYIEVRCKLANKYSRIRAELQCTIIREPIKVLRNLRVGSDDWLLASYPKSGNTWVKFMLADLLWGCNNGFAGVEKYIPYVGNRAKLFTDNTNNKTYRLYKTHEKYSLRYRNAIYIVRDGRDVAVSYYYHRIREGTDNRGFSEYLREFCDGKVGGYGSWVDNVSSWLQALNRNSCIHLIRYESLKQDPVGNLRKIVDFMGISVDDKDLIRVLNANTKSKIRKLGRIDSSSLNQSFVRKGVVGEWRDVFSRSDEKIFNKSSSSVMRQLGYID